MLAGSTPAHAAAGHTTLLCQPVRRWVTKRLPQNRGDVLELFGVGFHKSGSASRKGLFRSCGNHESVSLSMNQVSETPSFSGITEAGLYQINVKLPAGLGAGDVPLTGYSACYRPNEGA
jgi:uncharacterized protein (TIGR03437 family)